MKRETTQNRPCVKTCLTELKQVVKEVVQANGRHERRRCLLTGIKKMVEAIEIKNEKAIAKESKATKAGKQFSKQPKKVASKVKRHRA